MVLDAGALPGHAHEEEVEGVGCCCHWVVDVAALLNHEHEEEEEEEEMEGVGCRCHWVVGVAALPSHAHEEEVVVVVVVVEGVGCRCHWVADVAALPNHEHEEVVAGVGCHWRCRLVLDAVSPPNHVRVVEVEVEVEMEDGGFRHLALGAVSPSGPECEAWEDHCGDVVEVGWRAQTDHPQKRGKELHWLTRQRRTGR